MDKPFDISSIDDKITWQASSVLMMLVRKPKGDSALMIHCTPLDAKWMLAKTVVTSGDFDALKGALGNQELIGTFDDLQEAIGAGSMIARKWLADPNAASTAAGRDQQVIANHAGQLTRINVQMLERGIHTLGQQISTLTDQQSMLRRELEEARSAAEK